MIELDDVFVVDHGEYLDLPDEILFDFSGMREGDCLFGDEHLGVFFLDEVDEGVSAHSYGLYAVEEEGIVGRGIGLSLLLPLQRLLPGKRLAFLLPGRLLQHVLVFVRVTGDRQILTPLRLRLLLHQFKLYIYLSGGVGTHRGSEL